MKLIPGLHFVNFKHRYQGRWADSFFDYVSVAEAFRDKYGFSELGIELSAFRDYDLLQNLDQTGLADAGKQLRQARLHPSVSLGSIALNPSDERTRESVEAYAANFYKAKALGAAYVLFTAVPHGRMTAEKNLRCFRAAMEQLNSLAAAAGITCVTEEYQFFKSDQLLHALGGLSHIRFLNDTGNWMILGEDPVAATKKLLPITAYFHLKDYVLLDGIWHSVPLGEGYVDNAAILKLLAAQPDGDMMPVILETDMDDAEEMAPLHRSFEYFCTLVQS